MKIKFTLLVLIVMFFISDAKPDWNADACGLPFDSKFPCMLVKDTMWYSATDYGVFFSIHESQHWTNATYGWSDRVFNYLTFYGDFIIAGSNTGNVYYAAITYPHFVKISGNLPTGIIVHSLGTIGNNIFAGVKNREVYVSQDTGKTWTNRSNGLPFSTDGKIYLFTNGTSIYAATDGAGIFVSQNNGISWQSINTGLSNLNVCSIYFSGTNIFAGTLGSGVFSSTNNGQNWQQKNFGLGNLNVNALTILNNRLIAGTDSGVYASANNGNTWYPRNSGWDKPKVLSFATANLLHAGTESEMTWSIPIDEIISVKKNNSKVPEKFVLFQNYPNPFNPTTNIKFQMTHSSFVTLKIFNIQGKEVTTLINEYLQAGTYETIFSINYFTNIPLSSGIYFYKIEISDPSGKKENFTDIKKMVLVK